MYVYNVYLVIVLLQMGEDKIKKDETHTCRRDRSIHADGQTAMNEDAKGELIE